MWYVSAGTTTVGPFRSDIDANDWMDANTGDEIGSSTMKENQ
jgi:hypothetical protein